MSIDLSPLLDRALYEGEVNNNASVAIELALEAYEAKTRIGARPFEVLVSGDVDESWIRQQLVAPLVYYCESEGLPIPKCAGVLVTMFVGEHLYAIPAQATLEWAAELLGTNIEQLGRAHGIHETQTSLR